LTKQGEAGARGEKAQVQARRSPQQARGVGFFPQLMVRFNREKKRVGRIGKRKKRSAGRNKNRRREAATEGKSFSFVNGGGRIPWWGEETSETKRGGRKSGKLAGKTKQIIVKKW